jgi:hypothetical protein
MLLNDIKESDFDMDETGIFNVFCWDGESVTPAILLKVHGGITFSDNDLNYPIPSDLYWYGFDCAHSGDARNIEAIQDITLRGVFMRLDQSLSLLGGAEKRTLEYCIEQCEKLADQLVSVKELVLNEIVSKEDKKEN